MDTAVKVALIAIPIVLILGFTLIAAAIWDVEEAIDRQTKVLVEQEDESSPWRRSTS